METTDLSNAQLKSKWTFWESYSPEKNADTTTTSASYH